MGKRKLKTNPTTSDNDENNIPNEERKEKFVPFNFDENKCDVIIITVDREIHLPSSFLEMVSNDEDIQMTDGKIEIDVHSETLIKALSFYRPKEWKDIMKCKFLISLSGLKSKMMLKFLEISDFNLKGLLRNRNNLIWFNDFLNGSNITPLLGKKM